MTSTRPEHRRTSSALRRRVGVQPRGSWPTDARIIEIGVQNCDLARDLRCAGYGKYLGVSRDKECIAHLQARHPEFAADIVFSDHRKVIRRNNAEVLILSEKWPLHVWKYRSVRHAQTVAWRANFNLYSLIGLLGCFVLMLIRAYSWPRLVKLPSDGGKLQRIFTTNVLRCKTPGQNSLHFIPHRSGVSGVFQAFNKQRVRYAVLRWFEALPVIQTNEDVDLLVADDSLAKALEILNQLPGIQPCDLYSETGLPGSDYCGTPYYPALVAKQILANAIRHKNLCSVPSPGDYFHSLAYHAVYHKGYKAHLRRDGNSPSPQGDAEHNYAGILGSMADDLAIDVDVTLEGLHTYLQRSGWGPSPDMLRQLAAACWRNPWLQELAGRDNPHTTDRGLVVFLLSATSSHDDSLARFEKMIFDFEFDVMFSKQLATDTTSLGTNKELVMNYNQESLANIPRGFPTAIVVATATEGPSQQTSRLLQHSLPATHRTSGSRNDDVFADNPSKAFHVSQDTTDAWRLIETFTPEFIDTIRDQLTQPISVQPPRAA